MLSVLPSLFLYSLMSLVPLLRYPRPTLIAFGALAPVLLLARFNSPVRYYTRLALFLLGLGTASVWGVLVSLGLSLWPGQSKNINWVVARSFHLLVAPLVGFNFHVEGEHHLVDTRPAVVIGNHQTMIDILCTSPAP